MAILERTNQLWKLYTFVALMAVGAGITLFQGFLYKVLEKDAITALVIGAMVLVIAVFAWANSSIICPDCKLKLLWYSISNEGLGKWFTWLINLEKCPQCETRNAPGKKTGKSRGSQ